MAEWSNNGDPDDYPPRWLSRALCKAGRICSACGARLMVKPGPHPRPQASEGEAQHGLFCWTRRVGTANGLIIISLSLGPGRSEFGPAVVRVRTAKSAVAGDHLLHAHVVGWQTAIVRKEIALTRARAPRHLSGLADAKVEQDRRRSALQRPNPARQQIQECAS